MVIETERLVLRSFTEDDYIDVYEYLKSPTVNCFMSMKLDSLEEAKKEVLKRVSETDYYFAIVLKETNHVIGEIFAYPEDRDKDTFSPCWMLNEKYQKKGYTYEAAKAIFDYLFTEKNARRIYAYTEDDNIASQKLCEKLGMRKEGMFIEFVTFVNNSDGTPRYENTIQYAILKKEWMK